jgi:hypothetical protein
MYGHRLTLLGFVTVGMLCHVSIGQQPLPGDGGSLAEDSPALRRADDIAVGRSRFDL